MASHRDIIMFTNEIKQNNMTCRYTEIGSSCASEVAKILHLASCISELVMFLWASVDSSLKIPHCQLVIRALMSN